jgi:hypothetical protein
MGTLDVTIRRDKRTIELKRITREVDPGGSPREQTSSSRLISLGVRASRPDHPLRLFSQSRQTSFVSSFSSPLDPLSVSIIT